MHTLADPPRPLPLFSRLMILAGGFYVQFGSFFFGFGMIFFWVFSFNAFLDPGEIGAGGVEGFFIGLTTLIFPLVGAIFIGIGFKRNMKSLDLLQYGYFTRGVLLNKKATAVSINEQKVYEFSFEFEARDGDKYIAKGRTHHTHLLEDEQTERILYAAKDPSYAALYDIIPYSPKILPNGKLAAVPFYRSYVLILPILNMLVHGGIALIILT